MAPVAWISLAVISFSFQNVILDEKLKGYSALTMLIMFSVMAIPIAGLILFVSKSVGHQHVMPTGSDLRWILAVGLLVCIGQIFFLTSYTSGGDVITITMIVTLLPIGASIVKFCWVGGLPNMYQITGYILAFVAVLLILRGGLTEAT